MYKLSVCCRLDGHSEVMVTANEFRADVAAAGYGDGCYGFSLNLQDLFADGRAHTFELSVLDHPAFKFPGCSHAIVLNAIQIEIRSATADDVVAFAQFWREHLLSYGLAASNALADAELLLNKTQQHHSGLCVAVIGGQIIGFCALEGRSEPNYQHVALLRIAVLAIYRGKGVGKRLMAAIIEQARNIGLHRLELTVNAANTAAIQLYSNFQFQVEGRLRDVYCSDGVYSDELLMAYILPPVVQTNL